MQQHAMEAGVEGLQVYNNLKPCNAMVPFEKMEILNMFTGQILVLMQGKINQLSLDKNESEQATVELQPSQWNLI